MLIDIQTIVQNRETCRDVAVTISPESLEVSYQGYRLIEPVCFQGTLCGDGSGVIKLEGRLQTAYTGECARCLQDVRTPLDLPVRETYRPAGKSSGSLDGDDPALSYAYAGYRIDILTALRDNLVLALPPKLLCRAECRGICPVCGANRNEAICVCTATGAAEQTV
jgi:uncharacterized protein